MRSSDTDFPSKRAADAPSHDKCVRKWGDHNALCPYKYSNLHQNKHIDLVTVYSIEASQRISPYTYFNSSELRVPSNGRPNRNRDLITLEVEVSADHL